MIRPPIPSRMSVLARLVACDVLHAELLAQATQLIDGLPDEDPNIAVCAARVERPLASIEQTISKWFMVAVDRQGQGGDAKDLQRRPELRPRATLNGAR